MAFKKVNIMHNLQYLLDLVREQEIDIYTDSRQVKANSIFVALRGNNDSGAIYVPQALELGAKYIVCDKESLEKVTSHVKASAAENIDIICYENIRKAIWLLASNRYKTAEMDMLKLGITGTNGKTTTAYILEHIFISLGYKVGVLGTVSYRWPGYSEDAPLTTPDSLKLHKILAKMHEAGVKIVIMEISSHALSQERIGGVDFDAAIFTNLTQDHLDYHENMEDYFKAKSILFTKLPKRDKFSVINSDDLWGKILCEKCHKSLSYGFKYSKADNYLKGKVIKSGTNGILLEMEYKRRKWKINSLLLGKFNAYNLLSAQALCLSIGFKHDDFLCLENFTGVCGRLERVENSKKLDIFVDYAHTPDALENVLKSLHGLGFKKIITVFGCGGNRDKAKRPLMGKAVCSWSDIAILTSDNPRHEQPEDIIADVLPGMSKDIKVIVEQDRRLALKIALKTMRKGDVLLVAGKGHECYQQIGEIKHPFSDQKIIKELLECV